MKIIRNAALKYQTAYSTTPPVLKHEVTGARSVKEAIEHLGEVEVHHGLGRAGGLATAVQVRERSTRSGRQLVGLEDWFTREILVLMRIVGSIGVRVGGELLLACNRVISIILVLEIGVSGRVVVGVLAVVRSLRQLHGCSWRGKMSATSHRRRRGPAQPRRRGWADGSRLFIACIGTS